MPKCLPFTKNDYYIKQQQDKKWCSPLCSFVTVTVLLIATWVALPLVFIAVRNHGSFFFRQSNCSGKVLNMTTVIPVFNLTPALTVPSLSYTIIGQDTVSVLSRGFKFFENEEPKTVGFEYLLPSYTIQSVNGTDLFARNVVFGTERNMEYIPIGQVAKSYTFYYKIFGAESAGGSMTENSQLIYEVVNNAIVELVNRNEIVTILRMEVAESTKGPWDEIEVTRKYTLVPDSQYLKQMVKQFL